MKIKLLSVLLYILPFIQSCNDVSTADNSASEQDLPVSSTWGNLKVKLTYQNGRTAGTFCLLGQTDIRYMSVVRRNYTPINEQINIAGIQNIEITNWTGGIMWGRVVSVGGIIDSMCCNSVRLSGGTWYLENTTDTLRRPFEPLTVVNVYETCLQAGK